MGTTAARLRWAKKKGGPGFRGSRVYPGELAPWLKEQEAGRSEDGEPFDKEGWEIRKLRLQCESIAIENKKKGDEVWDSNLVRTSWLMHLRAARQVVLQMATDLAPRIAGRPALECEGLLTAVGVDVLGKLGGNPYGEGVCACGKCREPLELLFRSAEVLTAKAAKSAKKKRRKR